MAQFEVILTPFGKTYSFPRERYLTLFPHSLFATVLTANTDTDTIEITHSDVTTAVMDQLHDMIENEYISVTTPLDAKEAVPAGNYLGIDLIIALSTPEIYAIRDDLFPPRQLNRSDIYRKVLTTAIRINSVPLLRYLFSYTKAEYHTKDDEICIHLAVLTSNKYHHETLATKTFLSRADPSRIRCASREPHYHDNGIPPTAGYPFTQKMKTQYGFTDVADQDGCRWDAIVEHGPQYIIFMTAWDEKNADMLSLLLRDGRIPVDNWVHGCAQYSAEKSPALLPIILDDSRINPGRMWSNVLWYLVDHVNPYRSRPNDYPDVAPDRLIELIGLVLAHPKLDTVDGGIDSALAWNVRGILMMGTHPGFFPLTDPLAQKVMSMLMDDPRSTLARQDYEAVKSAYQGNLTAVLEYAQGPRWPTKQYGDVGIPTSLIIAAVHSDTRDNELIEALIPEINQLVPHGYGPPDAYYRSANIAIHLGKYDLARHLAAQIRDIHHNYITGFLYRFALGLRDDDKKEKETENKVEAPPGGWFILPELPLDPERVRLASDLIDHPLFWEHQCWGNWLPTLQLGLTDLTLRILKKPAPQYELDRSHREEKHTRAFHMYNLPDVIRAGLEHNVEAVVRAAVEHPGYEEWVVPKEKMTVEEGEKIRQIMGNLQM